MTLILGMSKADGVYMSSDCRLMRNGVTVDDTAVKFVEYQYPPLETGPRALFGYSGMAELGPRGIPMGQWLRETLRGETETINESMSHLRNRLDRDVRRWREVFELSVLVVEGERRLLGRLTNAHDVRKPFQYSMQEFAGPFAFAHGSGRKPVLREHKAILEEQLHVTPRSPSDHMGLLAAINRRVASVEPSVSPWCHVSYADPTKANASSSQIYTEPGEKPLPIALPFLLAGIDFNDSMAELMQSLEGDARSGMSEDTIRAGLKRRP